MTYKQRKWKQEFKSERPKRRGRAGQYAKGKWKQNPLPAPEPLNWSGPYIQAYKPYRAFSPGQANLPVYNESININQDTSPWGFTQVTSFPQRPELDINQDTSPWGFTQVTSFHQRQVFGHQPGQSPWGFLLKSWVFLRNQKLDISQDNHTEVFAQVTSFPQRPDFGHQPSRDRDKLYSISMRQVSNIWKSFNATLSDSNPSHAPQSRVSVKETDFVNGRNMLNWTV